MPMISDILSRIVTEILGPVEAVIFAAGFLMFLWGLVQAMYNLSEGGPNDEGKRHMVWGVVGMTIMVSIWGIVALIDNTFGLGALSGNGPATDIGRAQQITDMRFPNN
jgi:hypothetical protein